MDLSRTPNATKLHLCKSYFFAGICLLPFVWIINTCWFFNEAFRKPHYDEQSAIKRYVIYSAIGSFFWIVGLTVWIFTFQINRVEWGEFADSISFIIPLGKA